MNVGIQRRGIVVPVKENDISMHKTEDGLFSEYIVKPRDASYPGETPPVSYGQTSLAKFFAVNLKNSLLLFSFLLDTYTCGTLKKLGDESSDTGGMSLSAAMARWC